MNLLTRAQHAYLDALMVVVFALAPLMFGLDGAGAALSYVLAGVHLIMSLVTADLPGALRRIIPLPLHGLIEASVAVALGLVAWLIFDSTEQVFFLVMAAVILLVFAITPYLDGSN